MSQETAEWLNENILVGDTDKRGHAWHYRAELQGDEPNHYAGAIPVEDVVRRLFSWDALVSECVIRTPDGHEIVDTERLAIVRSDTHQVLGIHGKGYVVHPYSETLITTTANVIGDELHIGSAGLLRNGAQAFLQIEMPDNITVADGFDIRPALLACTSLDGSLATQWKSVVTRVVCDNTLACARAEGGRSVSFRHTKNSPLKIATVQQALGLIHKATEDEVKAMESLLALEVSDAQWREIVARLEPAPTLATDDPSFARVNARRDNKVAELSRLYYSDPRCAPWNGTGLGVSQAFNTYALHSVGKNTGRAIRNMNSLMAGTQTRQDERVLETLFAVCVGE